ncbi:MAG: hypothetical protein AAGI22_29370 [Planctomycetota bacterium]
MQHGEGKRGRAALAAAVRSLRGWASGARRPRREPVEGWLDGVGPIDGTRGILLAEQDAARERLAASDLRERRRERVTAALAGGFVHFVAIVAFPAPSTFLISIVTFVGALSGALAHALGDHARAWLVASLVGSIAISPFASGPLFVLLVVALAIGSAAAGSLRDPR